MAKEKRGQRERSLFEKSAASYSLRELVSLDRVEQLLRGLHEISKIPICLVSPDDELMICIGWQKVCERFHKNHPVSANCCRESHRDVEAMLTRQPMAAAVCRNGLQDIAMPIKVEGVHLGTLFLGQFLYSDEVINRDFFTEQAQKYDWPVDEYMRAIEEVPRISRDEAKYYIRYASGLVELLAELGYKNIRLAEEVQERKIAEHAFREGERQYKALVENVPGAVYQCLNDETYSTIFISEEIEVFTGFNAQVMISEAMPIAAIIHPDDLAYVQETVDKAVSIKQPYLLNYRMQRKDGSYAWVEERGQGVWDETGELRFLQGVIFDVSERRHLEEERRKFDEQLARSHKLESLGVLAGGIAHDFNNLLVAVLGHADMVLEETEPGTTTYESVNAIIQAAQRAANLTRQMLAYSGKGHFMVEPVNLTALVETLKPFFKTMYPPQYRFNYLLSEGVPRVCADPQQLKQLITNLITNAVESYDDAAGTITIKTGVRKCDTAFIDSTFHNERQPSEEYVFLEVSDKGCGMTEETRRRLCDPFFSTKFTGRGLGMAVVLGIVRGHRGLINVDSKWGKGTAIQILLPAFIPEAVVREDTQITLKKKNGGRILLVDDEGIVRSVAQKMIERAGFNVLVAQNGWEALRLLDQYLEAIDCIILDLTMPSMDGAKTLNAIRDRSTRIPVILSSGYGEDEVSSRLCTEHIAAFLQKPYKASDLMETLHRVLG